MSVCIQLTMEEDVQMVEAPNSKTLLCKVCGSNAIKCLSYGAIVCASCRSFFRRTLVRKSGEPKCCLFFQKCGEVSGKKRSTCPYCRFQKCLEVGMLRSKVTGVKRKYEMCDSQKYPCSPLDVQPRKSKDVQAKECKVVPVSAEACSSIVLGQSVLCHAGISPECQDELIAIAINSDDVPLQIQEIQKIFIEIYAEVDNPLFLVDHFISGHMNSNAWGSSHSKAFLQLIEINIFANFDRFANQNRFFYQLNPSDKSLLLNCNSYLFSEYIMARYMVEETAIDQVTWILGPNVPVDCLLTLADSSPIRFEDLNQADGMIVPKVDPKAFLNFKECLELIKMYFPYPKYHSPLIANLLLFSTSHLKPEELDALVDPDAIKALENNAKDMIQYGSQEISHEIGTAYLSQLVETLQYMHSLKDHQVNLVASSITDSQYSVPFEKKLMQKLVAFYNEINLEVSGDSVFAETLTNFLIHNTYDPQSGLWIQYYNLINR